jgi:hypothetical protein
MESIPRKPDRGPIRLENERLSESTALFIFLVPAEQTS